MDTIVIVGYFIVNDNPLTINPKTGERFTHRFCTHDGMQVPASEAMMYASKTRAQERRDIFTDYGIQTPLFQHQSRALNCGDKEGHYRVIQGKLLLPETDQVY